MPIIAKFRNFIFEYKTGELSWYTMNIYLNWSQKHANKVLKRYYFHFSTVLNLISSDVFLATWCLLSWFFLGYWLISKTRQNI